MFTFRTGLRWRIMRWLLTRPTSPFTGFLAEECRRALAWEEENA